MKLQLVHTPTGRIEETRNVSGKDRQERSFIADDMLSLCGDPENYRVDEVEE